MAEMKLDRPYMELHDGHELNLGGYPIHTPSQEKSSQGDRGEPPALCAVEYAKLVEIDLDLQSVYRRLGTIERLLLQIARPWYVRFWEWLFRS